MVSKTEVTLVAATLAAVCGTTLLELRTHAADAPHVATATVRAAEAATVDPAQAIRRLQEGNQRFVCQRTTGERRDALRRRQVAAGQHPFAVVLGCADSRVPPEVVFDQGLGDLFVIRVAGEVAPPEVIGSIEYAVEHLGCRTVIVLGHERCGAVEAALQSAGDEHPPSGNVGELLKDIKPAIEKIDRKAPYALEAAVRANARCVARTIVARSAMLDEMSRKGQLLITPARYDLESGRIEFLDQTGASASAGH